LKAAEGCGFEQHTNRCSRCELEHSKPQAVVIERQSSRQFSRGGKIVGSPLLLGENEEARSYGLAVLHFQQEVNCASNFSPHSGQVQAGAEGVLGDSQSFLICTASFSRESSSIHNSGCALALVGNSFFRKQAMPAHSRIPLSSLAAIASVGPKRNFMANIGNLHFKFYKSTRISDALLGRALALPNWRRSGD
jgi:hypothetical protein